jgi:hypothetical protein
MSGRIGNDRTGVEELAGFGQHSEGSEAHLRSG